MPGARRTNACQPKSLAAVCGTFSSQWRNLRESSPVRWRAMPGVRKIA